MGCSSSARSRPQEPPSSSGAPTRASSGENSPIADDYETVADQTQLDAVEGVSLASEELKLDDHLPGEEATAVTPALEPKIASVPEREEPEGTEPPRVAPERSSELPAVWREESSGTAPPALRDSGGPPAPRSADDSGLVEGTDSFVVETIKKVHIAEEDHFIEGETGEQVESELLSQIVSGGPETKEEETGEAVDGAAATEIETTSNKD
ncbi:glutamate-rich protein 5 isoform X2 [Phasianus colchicus]|uniref:glutamate-rich protein 5 isoform X2 n=1 Tax=Phasianus colchicus TaxID=9054 RepID=UPI00129E5E4A|nr:glutamate-rich protein 5 isoform X2 [Phasianus colchicus]